MIKDITSVDIDRSYSSYVHRLSGLKKNCKLTLGDEMLLKEHANQIDSVVLLSNGDIAISGGPLNYEVLIYRAKDDDFDLVDSISSGGVSV